MSDLVPEFEQAMKISMVFCQAWDRGGISDEVLSDKVGELIATRDGIRGFFVVTMSGDCPLLDRLPDTLLSQLIRGGDDVVDITVRNLAMSTAMSLHHHRKSDIEHQRGSERVAARCIELLRVLEAKSVKKRLEQLLNGLEGLGDDEAFLGRWEFDNDQKKAIAVTVNGITRNPNH